MRHAIGSRGGDGPRSAEVLGEFLMVPYGLLADRRRLGLTYSDAIVMSWALTERARARYSLKKKMARGAAAEAPAGPFATAVTRVVDVCAATGRAPSTVRASLARLQAAGLLERESVPGPGGGVRVTVRDEVADRWLRVPLDPGAPSGRWLKLPCAVAGAGLPAAATLVLAFLTSELLAGRGPAALSRIRRELCLAAPRLSEALAALSGRVVRCGSAARAQLRLGTAAAPWVEVGGRGASRRASLVRGPLMVEAVLRLAAARRGRAAT